MGYYDYYDYGWNDYNWWNGYGRSSGFWEFLAILFGILVVIFLVIAVIQLALYILRGIGVMRLATRQGLGNPWLIWIPVVGVFTIGALADDIAARQGAKTYFRWLLPAGNVLGIFLSSGSILALFPLLRDLRYLFSGYSPYYHYGGGASLELFANMLTMISSMLSIAILVVTAMALYRIFQYYHPQNATVYLVLSVLLGLQSVFLFTIRNRQPQGKEPVFSGGFPPAHSGYPPAAYPPYGQPQGYDAPQAPQPGYPPPGMPAPCYPPPAPQGTAPQDPPPGACPPAPVPSPPADSLSPDPRDDGPAPGGQ